MFSSNVSYRTYLQKKSDNCFSTTENYIRCEMTSAFVGVFSTEINIDKGGKQCHNTA